MKQLLTLLVAGLVSAVKYDNKVMILDQKSFDQEFAKHDLLVVEFYAPWCQHCKDFAPEYQKIAKQLVSQNPSISVAKVNGDKNASLMERFKIQGFPTLIFFKNGKEFRYEGALNKKNFLKWLNKKSNPPSKAATCTQIKEAIQEHELVLVYFGNNQNQLFSTAFLQLAEEQDKLVALHNNDSVCITEYKLKEDRVILFRNFDTPQNLYEGPATKEELESWLKPLMERDIVPLNNDELDNLFSHGLSSLVLFRFANQSEEAFAKAYEQASKEFKGRIQFMIYDEHDEAGQEFAHQFFKLTEEDLPTLRAIYFREIENPEEEEEIQQSTEEIKKFRFGGQERDRTKELTVDSLGEFITSILEHSQEKYIKSQPIPEPSDDPVKVIVGRTFDQIAKDPTKDVLVMFYAPWCQHCKNLMPVWEQLAKDFKNVKDLVIAKIDDTANEVNEIDLDGYPTIAFYSMGEYQEPQIFDKQPSLKSLKRFLQRNAQSLALQEKDEL